MRAFVCPSLVLACFLAGCLAKPIPIGPNGAATKEQSISQSLPGKIGPANRPNVSPTGLPTNPAPAIAPIIANNSGSLIGVVKVPASIIANNGGSIIANNSGSIIANNSGSIIANNSGSYRLLSTIEQKPVAGITVHLFDAGGNPITDKDGKPMVAVTDDKGQYKFTGFVPARNLVLKVQLSESLGQLQAIVAKSSEEKRVVDMDLVSTLVTNYILDQYVKGQPEPQVTLDKLPKDVEKDTRVKAATALESGVSVPNSLTTTEVVKTVTAMRQKNATFNDQMELVKRLLIAAGQSDMGSGRLATEVSLAGIEALALGPDGSLYIAASTDRRVWRLKTDGRIEAVAGSGTIEEGSLDGKNALEAGYASPARLTFDSQGRLVILERGYDDYPVQRLTRLEAGGKVTAMGGNSDSDLALPADGDNFWLLRSRFGDLAAEVQKLLPDKTTQLYHTFTSAETKILRYSYSGGRDAQGRLYIGSESWAVNGTPEGPVVYRFDPATKALSRYMGKTADQLKGLNVDPAGNVFYVDGQGKLMVRKPDGSTIKLLDALPAEFYADSSLRDDTPSVLLAPDGSAYMTQGYSLVYRIQNGQAKLVAGVTTTTGNQAQDLALQEPAGVAVAADGTMIVGDAGLHQLVRITKDGKVSLLAGTGEAGYSGDGGAALQAKLNMPMAVRLDGAGNVYFTDNDAYSVYRIRKIGTDGKITTLLTDDKNIIYDMVVTATGTVFYITNRSLGEGDDVVEVKRLATDGALTTIIPDSFGLYGRGSLAIGPDGDLYIHNSHRMCKWTVEQGARLIKADDRFRYSSTSELAIDVSGRFYLADTNRNCVIRWDPATDTVKVVAGPNSPQLNGTGVNDSLSWPGYLCFDSAGTLYISDERHKQIKALTADKL